MWQYIFLMLRRQRGRSVLASSGFLLAACALVLLSATTQTTVGRANQIINQNWRPAYDLVVLPSSVTIPKNQNVPPDLLAGYGGGISIQQYQQIQHIPGIDVAAPIAYVGYVQMPVPSIYFTDQMLPTGYYKIDWTMTAFNGQKTIAESHTSDIVYISFNCNFSNPSDPNVNLLDKLYSLFGIQQENCNSLANPLVSFSPSDSTGTFLLAGIDPTSESQLVHLNKSITEGRMLSEQDTVHLDKRIPDNPGYNPYLHKTQSVNAIPMLIHQQLPGQIALHATFTKLYTGSLTPDQIENAGGLAFLERQPQTIFQGNVPLVQNDPQRFSGASLLWNGHSWQTILSSQKQGIDPFYALDFFSSYTPAGLTYQPATAPDGSSGYRLVPQGQQQGPEASFRTLSPLNVLHLGTPRSPETYFDYEAVGQFSNSGLTAQLDNPLNWLPENTYTVPPVTIRYDAQGHPVSATKLLPTTNPSGFVTQPPLALTTISAARELVGDHCINAIRVRVSGNVTADDNGWKHVTQVAQLIHQQTGLTVQVTLGSSPQPTLVYIPGIKQGDLGAQQDIAPIGWVEERWIHIGVALIYLGQLGQTRLLLLGAVLLVCLGYLWVTLSSLLAAQRRELGILSALGWRPWHPVGTFLAQVLALSLSGGIVGIGVALLIVALIGASPPWEIVAWTLPVVLVLALISVLYPLWNIWRISPAEVLREGTGVSSEKRTRRSRLNAAFWSRLPAVGGMALRNLTRSRWRAVIAVGSLFLSAILLTVMVDGILAFRQTLQGTLLGDYVLLQTAIPQIAGAIFAILLTFLSVADLLLLQVRERQKEIGLLQAVGWRPNVVQRLFVQEGLTLAIAGSVPGVLVALWILNEQHAAQGAVPAPFVAGGAVILMLIVAGLATIPAVRAVNRLPVSDVLRAE